MPSAIIYQLGMALSTRHTRIAVRVRLDHVFAAGRQTRLRPTTERGSSGQV